MVSERSLNLLGALVLGLVDTLTEAVETGTGYGGGAPATLVTLGAEPGISINTLRQILNLSHPGTVRLIDKLEADGLVERRQGNDGRTIALFLTAAGQQRRIDILAQRRQKLLPAFNSLTPAEQEQLASLLEKMLVAMTTDKLRAYAICRLCDEDVCPAESCPVEQSY
jgi:MarR family transcriptional regulator, negative regulator of the multidrug operon emrRAB